MAEPQVRSALVITASDGAAAGVREDTSGAWVGERLEGLGFQVVRRLVADDLAAGRLRAVLDEHLVPERSIFVVYVASRFVPLRISEVARQLVAALREP